MLILSSHCRLAAAAIPASVAGIYSSHRHNDQGGGACPPIRVSAYRHHNRASVPAELLKSGDEASCLCDQHAGIVIVLAWIEYRVMGATDKFEESIA